MNMEIRKFMGIPIKRNPKPSTVDLIEMLNNSNAAIKESRECHYWLDQKALDHIEKRRGSPLPKHRYTLMD
jgi:hypothetical protein